MEGPAFRFRVSVVPARPIAEDDDNSVGQSADDGWELVRSGQTKDGVSTLLVYRRPA